MSKKIGLICEDRSDLEVFNEILKKYTSSSKYTINKFIAKGCGKINNKCKAWVKNLSDNKCQYIFVIQDLDEKNEVNLRKILEEKVKNNTKKPYVVVIPVVEIEAWLLIDSRVLKKVFNLKLVPKQITNPELEKDPKRKIAELVKKYRRNKNIKYSNTQHNEKIAKGISKTQLKKCNSFKPLDIFLSSHFKKK